MKILISFLLSILLCQQGFSQTIIWTEDFQSYADGVVVGANNNTANPANDWTLNTCTSCAASPEDYWEVRGGLLSARDVNEELVTFTSEVIDISGFPSINFTVTVSESGDLEGLYLGIDDCADAPNQDFADVEYRIDGGAWVLISNALGWCGLYESCGTHTLYGDDGGTTGDCRTTDTDWESADVGQNALTGSTLELRLSCTNSAGTEFIRFDNIIVEENIPLPVTLTSFTAKSLNTAVEIEWETSSETDNDFFTLERSKDGKSFSTLTTEKGAGDSNELLSYKILDQQPLSGISYYRLKQTDFDGQFEYSDIVVVSTDSFDEHTPLAAFPNPVVNTVTITGNETELENFRLLSLSGKDLTSQITKSSKGENGLTLDLTSLENGIYIFRTNQSSHRLIKK